MVKDLSTKITDTRQNVATVKSDIDGMRSKRDAIVGETSVYSVKVKEQNNRIIQSTQEKARLEKLVAENEVKRIQLKQLREKLQNKRAEVRRNSFSLFIQLLEKYLKMQTFTFNFSSGRSKATRILSPGN